MVEISERYYHSKDGSSIFYRSAVPENPIASVIILHGYAEHSGRYLHVIDYLAGRNLAVFAPDERGHGKTAKTLGDIESFKLVLEDIDLLVTQADEKFPTRPIFMLGHSMGALLAVLYAERFEERLRGLILSGAALVLPDNVSPFLKKIAGFIARVAPRLQVQTFDSSGISRDPEVIRKKDEDPLYYKGKTMARTGDEMLKGIESAIAGLKSISLPILILHGGADPIISPEASKMVYENVSSEDKTLKLFEGLYHEIMNEPEKDEVLEFIGNWIEKRI